MAINIDSNGIASLAVAAVLCTALVSCNGSKSVSDEAARVNAEACAKLNKEPFIHMTAGEVKIGCKP